MMYGRLLRWLGEEGKADSVHAASAVAVEFQSALAILLLVFLAGRFISVYAGVLAAAAAAAVFWGRSLTGIVYRENDDRFQTLLFYLMVTLASTLALVGWLS